MKRVLLVAFLMAAPMGWAQQAPQIPYGVDALTDLSTLPLLPENVWFHSVSSQDVTGGNDDGFSGAFSYLYMENGRYVLLDTHGPGCVTLFRVIHHDRWNGTLFIRTTQGGVQSTDRFPFADLYSGRRAPFLNPLVGDEDQVHGSSWSLVPICSEDGIKISTDKPGMFLDIYYDQFGPGVPVKAYSPSLNVQPAIQRWENTGRPFDARPAESVGREVNLPAYSIVPVWSSPEAGTLTGLYVEAPKMTHELLRHVRVRIYWDGQENAAVDSPLGPFFGTGYWPVPDPPGAPPRYGYVNHHGAGVRLGRIATKSLPAGAGSGGFYNLFPMPFFKSCRLVLFNEGNVPMEHIKVTVHVAPGPPPQNSGYFHAQWREEDPTLLHRDYTVLETRGHGRYVGAVLVLSSVNFDPARKENTQRSYLEGDARFYIDDNRTFANASTGTEEYFLWGFYEIPRWDSVFSYAVNGYPLHDVDSQDHSVMYRFHLSDAVPYYRSFRFALEHGGEGEGVWAAQPSNYSGTAFYYQRDAPVLSLTDQFTLGDKAGLQAHAYHADKTVWTGCRDLPFEGDRQALFNNAYIADQKAGARESAAEALHACGERDSGWVEFTASILPGNRGVKLRRMLDYAPPDLAGQELAKRPNPLIVPAEVAQVIVDGKDAGVWETAPRHARLAWLEDDLEIPARFTAGKSRIVIRLNIATQAPWSAFEYRVFTYLPER